MKIKDYNDAIEFFRTNDYKAADGAWSEFYQSEVLEPRITDLADDGRIPFGKGGDFEKWIKDQIDNKNTTFRTKGELYDAADVKASGNNQKILNKYMNEFTITSGSRLGGDIVTKNTAIKNFFDLQEPGSKINVERAVKDINKTLPENQQISESIITNRLKDKKFNTNFLGSQTLGQYHGELSDAMKHNIIAKFGDEYDITMESFTDQKKYGISAGGKKDKKGPYEMIRRAVSDKNTQWNKAYNVGAADGWILHSMERAGFKPIMGMIGDRERVIGYEDSDGTKWFSSKKAALKNNGKYVKTAHPGWDRVNHLVNIVKETRVAPSKAITDLLRTTDLKGVTLESLTSYLLDNNADVRNIKQGLRTFPKHHVKGVKGSYADDIQLVTRIANERANSAVSKLEKLKKKGLPISDEVYNAIDTELKNLDVTIEVDGKRLGSTGTGFESKADIEKFVTKKISAWTDDDHMKFLKKLGYRCPKASGGAGETLECYLEDVKKTKAEAKKGNLTAINKQRKAFDIGKNIKGFGKFLRRGVQGVIGGVGTAIGGKIGLALEGALEGGIYDYYRGKGYSHDQAYQETFFPGMITGRPDDVPWYGGAEELIEQEKIGTRWDPSGKVNLAAKYADAKSEYDSAIDKYNFINANMTTYANIDDWEKDLKAQEAIIQDLEPSVKVGTPEYEAYQIAEERQAGLMDERARDYKSKNRFLGLEWDLSPAQIKQRTPSKWKEEHNLRQREKEMDEYQTDKWGEPMKAFTLEPGQYLDWDAIGFGDEEGIKEKWKQLYEVGGMDLLDRIGIAGGVSNLAQGGIASLRKK